MTWWYISEYLVPSFLSSKIYAGVGFIMPIYVSEIWGSAERTVEIIVIWNVTPYSLVGWRRNVSSYQPDYTVPHPRRRLVGWRRNVSSYQPDYTVPHPRRRLLSNWSRHSYSKVSVRLSLMAVSSGTEIDDQCRPVRGRPWKVTLCKHVTPCVCGEPEIEWQGLTTVGCYQPEMDGTVWDIR